MPFDSSPLEAPLAEIERDLAILRRAREGIAQPGGWCQGFGTKGSAHCVMGWVSVASEFGVCQSNGFADRVLVPELPPRWARGFNIVEFNDCRGRKQAEVVALFDRAIARLERSV